MYFMHMMGEEKDEKINIDRKEKFKKMKEMRVTRRFSLETYDNKCLLKW